MSNFRYANRLKRVLIELTMINGTKGSIKTCISSIVPHTIKDEYKGRSKQYLHTYMYIYLLSCGVLPLEMKHIFPVNPRNRGSIHSSDMVFYR